MSFDSLNIRGQQFAEDNMGEVMTYTSPTGVVFTGLSGANLKGVFNQVTLDYTTGDFSVKKVTVYTVVSGKDQWGSVVPENGGIVTDSSSITYNVNQISGTNSAGEPAYEIVMKKLT